MSTPIPPDPYRIKRILNKLESAWGLNPKESLCNTLGRIETVCEVGDPDDDYFENALDRYLKDYKVDSWKS